MNSELDPHNTTDNDNSSTIATKPLSDQFMDGAAFSEDLPFAEDSFTTVVSQLAQLPPWQGGIIDPHYLTSEELCDYLERRHHNFLLRESPIVLAYMDHARQQYLREHPELATVAKLFKGVAAQLQHACERESTVLFPLIRAAKNAADESTSEELLSHCQELISQASHNHENIGDQLKEIRLILAPFTRELHSYPVLEKLQLRLEALVKDFYLGVHLKHNVLFPRLRRPTASGQ